MTQFSFACLAQALLNAHESWARRKFVTVLVIRDIAKRLPKCSVLVVEWEALNMTDIDSRARMKRMPCTPSNSILEGDLELAAKHNIIAELQVLETELGFYVIAKFADNDRVLQSKKIKGLPEWFYVLAQLLAEPGKAWYLTTRRDRESPRLFKDLRRLNEYLVEKFPTSGFVLLRNQELPGIPKTKTRPVDHGPRKSREHESNLAHHP